jgi:peptidoglycan/xylan/chitin deacetylase (PgdA/CDA1 family)
VARAAHRAQPLRHAVAVLTYHRVADAGEDDDLEPQLRSADPAGFRTQMEMLAREFRVLSLDEFLTVARTGDVPPRAVVITFDDAYASVAEHAWPVCRALGLPITVFVPTAYPEGGEFWWDRLYRALRLAAPQVLDTGAGPVALDGSQESARAATRLLAPWVKSLPHDRALAAVAAVVESAGGVPPRKSVADWTALRALHDEGVTLAPHGHVHAIWPVAGDALLREELEAPRAALRNQVGECPPVLAYPAGFVTPAVRDRVAVAGYEIGMTSEHGLNATRGTDWLMTRRVEISRAVDAPMLRALLHPIGNRLAARLL